MKLIEYIKNSPRGEISRIAKAIGSHSPDVSMWANGKRPVPAISATAIEIFTGGKVTRKDLRPDDWQKIWPELR